MNKNQFTVKYYGIDNQLIHKDDFLINKCSRDSHNKYFHTFDYKCLYGIKLTNIGKYEIVNLTIGDRRMNLYDLKKIKFARQKRLYI